MSNTGPIASTPANSESIKQGSSRRFSLRHGEISNLSFWISQAAMLVATVLGVFLAAQQGLQQAVRFDAIQGDKTNYYLRTSLQHELRDNVGLLRAYMDQIQSISVHNARLTSLKLDTFIWESMKYSSATLETPPALLSESRQFYRLVQDIHTKIQGGFYDVRYGSSLILQQIEHMETNVLPLFEKDGELLKASLKDRGVTL